MKTARSRMLVLAIVIVALLLSTACVKRDTAVENQPLSDNLAAYWTCAVAFSSDGRGADANEAFTFVPWFESRVRERGVFDPLARDEGAEAEVTLRLEARTADDRVSLRLVVLDTRTKESLGDLEAVASLDSNADAGDSSEPKRIVALRKAADQLIEILKEKRRASAVKARRPPPPPEAEQAPVGGSAVCTTQCHPPAASASSHDEQHRVAAGMNATMKELRECLDRVGAQLVDPAVILRFSPDGQLRHMRVDVGGYEQTECIRAVRTRAPQGVWTARASLLRCEYRCTTS